METPTKPIIGVDPRTPDGLRAALTARFGSSWAKVLARRARSHKTYISLVVAGRRTNERVRKIIANAIDLQPEDIWKKVA